MTQVGTNGVISFSMPFYYWHLYPFPGNFYVRRFHVVAPYWADNDIRRGGSVLYETFMRGRSTNDNIVLDNINRYLRVNNRTEDFTGIFMILAKWQNVPPLQSSSNRNQVNMYLEFGCKCSSKYIVITESMWHVTCT